MGIDEETERPAEQAAGDAHEAGSSSTQVPAPSSSADERVTGDGVTGDGEPGAEGHSEEWLANASKAAEKIRAMFKS
jgi:hypothetical protein